MKLLKDIFGRKTSIWLALELVLVTIACWWAFDPVIVTSYAIRQPMGYDAERLVRFEVASSVTQNVEDSEWREIVKEEEMMVQKVLEMDDVETAYAAASTPIGFEALSKPINFFHGSDSLQCWCFGFTPDSKMFEVYGIQSLTPGVPTAELSHDGVDEETLILTRSSAMKLFGTINVAGRKLLGKDGFGREEKESKYYTIRAVVEDVRHGAFDRDCSNAFLCIDGLPIHVPILARLREGVDASHFVQAHEQQVQHDFVTKHSYVRRMQTVREIQDKFVEDSWIGRQMRRNLFIAAFFALNLSFGVFGTLLMYTRQRREEAGVRRAFGATKWSVFWGFIREAWLLTTVSVVVGCAIYFQFVTASGLFDNYVSKDAAVPLWFDDFVTHFLVVSVIVYLIILCAVLIATAIPAWRICRSEITVALKDE